MTVIAPTQAAPTESDGQHSTENLGKKTAQGGAWLIASRLTTRLIDFVTLMVLARLLATQDFGLVAIAMSLIQLVEAVFDVSLAQILIRAVHVDDEMLATSFTLGLFRGLILAGVLCAAAWPASVAFHNQHLIVLIPFLSLAPILRGMQSPAMVRYARAMNFRPDLMIEVCGKLSSLVVALSIGTLTHSYWAIAAATVTGPLVMVMVSYAYAPFRPRFCLTGWRHFSSFIGWGTVSQMLSALNWQIDRLLLARFVPPAQLGGFTMASDLSALPYQALIVPMARPLNASYAMVSRDDGKLQEQFVASFAMLLALLLPVGIGFGMLAHPIVELMLGAKWQPAAVWLQWLAPLVVLGMFNTPVGALAMAVGRIRVFSKINLAEMVVKLPAMALLIHWHGVAGAVEARAVSACAMVLVYLAVLRSLNDLRPITLLRAFWPVFLAGAVLAALIAVLAPLLHGLASWRLALGLAGIVLTTAVGYGATLVLLGFGPARWLLTNLRERLKR